MWKHQGVNGDEVMVKHKMESSLETKMRSTPYIATTKEVITNSYKGHVVTYMVQSPAVACS